jgi:AmiR/NasT family two-component response regulator
LTEATSYDFRRRAAMDDRTSMAAVAQEVLDGTRVP